METVERVGGILVAVFTDDLLNRPGALAMVVDQEVKDQPVDEALVGPGFMGRLRVRGRSRSLCLGLGAGLDRD